MAGVADMAFRELCVEYGAAYVVSEMVSAKGVSMHDRKSGALMVLSEKERPAAIQIFGSDPKTMADAAVKAQSFTCEIVDINMGCPAPKIVNSGNGSALMKNPALAGEITAECVKAITLPVTVKMRSGWDGESINAVELAKRCEAAGASAITVHGRTRAQMYAPPVNVDIIREVKENVKIPVIGNGDV
ncbi:MAG: tRNA-dihydrouridine synthase family protein, partial [Clostridia bacterium]|nr:tRNA-dihydrouridine synthase family protein [Clostridia bacterium]